MKFNHGCRAVTSLHCPTCNTLFDIEKTKAMPFCSERCRQIDLGRWLNEDLSVPYIPALDEELGEAWLDDPQ